MSRLFNYLKFIAIFLIVELMITFITSLLNLIGLNSGITTIIMFILNIILFFILSYFNAYQKQNVAEYLLQRYNETYYPAFSYSEFTNDESFVNEITNYTSSKENKTVVKVGVCGQSNEQWKAVQKNLDDENLNIYIELVIFSTYNLPNEALNSKDIDLNAFQHYAYLESEVKAEGYDIVAIGETLIAPLTLYSKGSNSLEQLKEKLTKI